MTTATPTYTTAVASRTGQPGPNKRPERTAIEQLLQRHRTPLDAGQIAHYIACADVELVRACLGTLCQYKRAHRVTPLPGSRMNRYTWGPDPTLTELPAHATQSRLPQEHYDGAELRPFAARPGAMDAALLPSLRNGTRVEHHRPILMGGAPEGPHP